METSNNLDELLKESDRGNEDEDDEGLHRLSDLLKEYGAEKTLEILQTFHCSRDKDIEHFLHKTAIKHEMKHISRTYVLIHSAGKSATVTGYFTLAIKCLAVSKEREIDPEIREMMNINRGIAQAYLIGQISKSDGGRKGKGVTLLGKALQIIVQGKTLFGCSMVRIDCKNEPKLLEYYEEVGFTRLWDDEGGSIIRLIMFISE